MKNLAAKSFVSFASFALLFVVNSIAAFAQAAPAPNVENQPPAQSETKAQPGVVRIGVALPKAHFSEGVNNAEVAAGLREAIGQYLKGPNVEIVALDARLPAAMAAEAKQKECAYVLLTAVTQKKGGGGGFGKFMSGGGASMLGNVASLGGYGGYGGAVAGSIAVTAVQTAATMSSNVKSKDQITLEYQLLTADTAQPKAGEKLQAKAKADGEDVLSPMIEKLAETVLQAATK